MSNNGYLAASYAIISGRVTGGELFDEIVAREYYSEKDARYAQLLYTATIHVFTHTVTAYSKC